MNNNKLVEVKIIGFSPSQQPGGFAVFLQDKKSKKCLPIVVGIAEAQAISMMLSPEVSPRPMTYDTFKNIIDSLRGEITKVIITKLEENTFYADIILKNMSDDVFRLDARPSDSIAVALKFGAPIFVAEEVMNSSSIEIPDEMLNPMGNVNIVNPVDKLKSDLKTAIENEDYEKAAELRDQIKKLEGKDDNSK